VDDALLDIEVFSSDVLDLDAARRRSGHEDTGLCTCSQSDHPNLVPLVHRGDAWILELCAAVRVTVSSRSFIRHPAFFAGFFKIPSLWGVRRPPANFHDNRANTLEEVAAFYTNLFANNPDSFGLAVDTRVIVTVNPRGQ
jgi:hypothetical protein